MIPLTIELSDGLRDRLEAAIEKAWNDPSIDPYDFNTRYHRLGEVVGEVLFDCSGDASARNEAANIANALSDMMSASGAPAIYWKNLPNENGYRFARGIAEFLSHTNGEVHSALLVNRPDERLQFHQDTPFVPIYGKKIRLNYCTSPGWRPTPTIFSTADEAIEAMTKTKVGEHCSGAQHDETRLEIVASLRHVMVHPHDKGTKLKAVPLIYENPNYGPSAPHYIMCMPDIIDHSLEEVIPDPAHRQIFE